MTWQPSRIALKVTARIAGFKPGTSPPPVRIPMTPFFVFTFAILCCPYVGAAKRVESESAFNGVLRFFYCEALSHVRYRPFSLSENHYRFILLNGTMKTLTVIKSADGACERKCSLFEAFRGRYNFAIRRGRPSAKAQARPEFHWTRTTQGEFSKA